MRVLDAVNASREGDRGAGKAGNASKGFFARRSTGEWEATAVDAAELERNPFERFRPCARDKVRGTTTNLRQFCMCKHCEQASAEERPLEHSARGAENPERQRW